MEYITSSDFHFKDTAVALGKFEGIHRGHQLLMDEVKKQELHGLRSVVFTFDRPTRLTLTGDTEYKQIYTKKERREILEKRGIDILIEHPFTKEFAALTPDRFIREVLVEKVGAKVIVVGTDFHFGKNRSGSITDLEKLEEECGYHLIVVEKLQLNGKDISSTRITVFPGKSFTEMHLDEPYRCQPLTSKFRPLNYCRQMVCMFLKSTGKTKFTTALPTSEPSQPSTIPAKKQSRPISLISIKMFMAKKWS